MKASYKTIALLIVTFGWSSCLAGSAQPQPPDLGTALDALKNQVADNKKEYTDKFTEMTPEIVPVGAVVAYTRPPATLPPNWKFCDGSIISDPQSPLNGQATPVMNDSRYLVGVNPNEVNGSYGTNVWQSDGAHAHSFSGTTDNNAQPSGFGGDGVHSVETGERGSNPSLHKVGFNYGGVTNTVSHNHGEKRPLSRGVLWIIRIK